MNKNSNNKNRKKISADKKPPVWHFSAKNNIQSDVFGSYTGTAVPDSEMKDYDDIYPVQDADDL